MKSEAKKQTNEKTNEKEWPQIDWCALNFNCTKKGAHLNQQLDLAVALFGCCNKSLTQSPARLFPLLCLRILKQGKLSQCETVTAFSCYVNPYTQLCKRKAPSNPLAPLRAHAVSHRHSTTPRPSSPAKTNNSSTRGRFPVPQNYRMSAFLVRLLFSFSTEEDLSCEAPGPIKVYLFKNRINAITDSDII